MSKIKLKFDNRLNRNIIAIYPKPENYKNIVLKAIETDQKIPSVNEVFSLEKSIDTFIQEFPELEGFLEILETQDVSKANVIIDRKNSNVTIKGTSSEGDIDLKQTIEYANNSGTYTVDVSEGFSGNTEVYFSVFKQNVPIALPYFDTILDISEVDRNGAVTKIEFNNPLNSGFNKVNSTQEELANIKITEGDYYIQNENLLIRVGIGYVEIEGKKILTIKNHQILNGGDSNKVSSFPVKIYDGYTQEIVNQTLTNGVWSIPSGELIEGFYYNISFYAKNDSSFSGIFERVDSKFKYLERIKRVNPDLATSADNIKLENLDITFIQSVTGALAKDYDGVAFSNPCECKMVDSTGYMFLSGDTASQNPEDVQVYINRGKDIVDAGIGIPVMPPDGIRPTAISQVVRPNKFLMKNIVLSQKNGDIFTPIFS